MPDANTLWDFREALIASGALERLFTRLDEAITAADYLPMAGQIVDATLVSAPRQRNTDEEKARIKAGEKAARIWPDKPAKARQEDTDARWTVKSSKARPGRQAADRHRGAALRVQVAHLDRPPAWRDPAGQDHGCGGA